MASPRPSTSRVDLPLIDTKHQTPYAITIMNKDKAPTILYLITKSNFGGAQKYVFELAVEAKRRGYNVAVAGGGTGEACATTGLLFEKLSAAEVDTHHITHFMRDMSIKRELLAFFAIWRLLRKIKPDVLHVTSSKAGGIGAAAGRLAGIQRIVFTSHGLTVDETWRPRWQRALIYCATWTTMRLCHQSIMITNETFKRAQNLPLMKDRVSLVHNGIQPIDFIEREEARTSLAPQLPSNTLIIGGIGELHPNKNWQAAVAALTSLPENVHLFIMGEGEERDSLDRLIKHHHLAHRAHLLGHKDKAARFLKAFDVFILPSKKEGLPYVLLEAGLAELPTIASNLPGNHDIIETGQSGLLISPAPDFIATSVSMLLRDQGMQRRLGQALHKTVTTTFSPDRMYDKTFAIYFKGKQ